MQSAVLAVIDSVWPPDDRWASRERCAYSRRRAISLR